MRRFGGWPAIAFVLAACMPVVAPVMDDGPPQRPQLAIQVTNASDQEMAIGYEFEAFQSGGGGEGTVAPCELITLPFGPVGGSFIILVEGEVVFEDRVREAIPADAWVFVRVRISPDGEGEVFGTGVVAGIPDPAPRPIPDCG